MAIGVEYGAKYTLTGPDGTIAVFNASTDPNFVGILSPESSGLDSPDVREDAQERTEDDGGIHGNFYYGRRPIVLQGTISATSAVQRAERIEKLTRATNAMRNDAVLKWKPAGASEEVEVKLRRQQPLRLTKGFVKDFQASMVAADAYIYGVSEQTLLPANTGFVSPSEGATTGLWTGVNNVKSSDNAYAAVSVIAGPTSFDTGDLIAKNFGLAIPVNAQILGVEASIEKKKSGTVTSPIDTVKIVKGGAVVGTALSGAGGYTASDAVYTYGSATALGGLSLEPADVNSVGFGISLKTVGSMSGAIELSVDQMRLKLYYQQTSVVNGGDADSYPTMKIYGPVVNPTIKNVTTGKSIKLNYTVEVGKYITLNFKTRTITLNTGTNLYSKLEFATSEWWSLVPGTNILSVSPSSEFEASFRSAWV